MLTAISGTIENGQIHFDEQLPNKKGKVVLMFIDDFVDKNPAKYKTTIRFGGLEDMATLPDDFNEPLADLEKYM